MIAILVPVGSLLALWVAAAVGLDRWGHRPTVTGTFDTIVVAGAAVTVDGRPSGTLARRTRHAVGLWRAGAAPRILFTGGPSTGATSEAAVAASYALTQGLAHASLLVEESSTSTEENARNAAGMLGAARVLVVTDSYHALRCRRVFARFFPDVEVTTTRPPLATLARLALREVLVVAAYAVAGKLSGRALPVA